MSKRKTVKMQIMAPVDIEIVVDIPDGAEDSGECKVVRTYRTMIQPDLSDLFAYFEDEDHEEYDRQLGFEPEW